MFDKLPIPWKSDDTEDVDNFGLKWPLGWFQKYLVKRLGGIPVYRNSKKGMVERLIEEFEKKEEFLVSRSCSYFINVTLALIGCKVAYLRVIRRRIKRRYGRSG